MKPLRFSENRKFFFACDLIGLEILSIAVGAELRDGAESGAIYFSCNSDLYKEIGNFKDFAFLHNRILPRLPMQPDDRWKPSKQIVDEILTFTNASKENPIEMWGCSCEFERVALKWLFGSRKFADKNDVPPGLSPLPYIWDINQLEYHIGEKVSAVDDLYSGPAERVANIQKRFQKLVLKEKFDL